MKSAMNPGELVRRRTDDYQNVCRLCMTQTSTNLNIFNAEGLRRQIRGKILNCLSLIVTENDILPKSVCYDCVQKLDNFHDFRDTCHKTEDFLYSFMSSIQQYSGSPVSRIPSPKPLNPVSPRTPEMLSPARGRKRQDQFLSPQSPRTPAISSPVLGRSQPGQFLSPQPPRFETSSPIRGRKSQGQFLSPQSPRIPETPSPVFRSKRQGEFMSPQPPRIPEVSSPASEKKRQERTSHTETSQESKKFLDNIVIKTEPREEHETLSCQDTISKQTGAKRKLMYTQVESEQKVRNLDGDTVRSSQIALPDNTSTSPNMNPPGNDSKITGLKTEEKNISPESSSLPSLSIFTVTDNKQNTSCNQEHTNTESADKSINETTSCMRTEETSGCSESNSSFSQSVSKIATDTVTDADTSSAKLNEKVDSSQSIFADTLSVTKQQQASPTENTITKDKCVNGNMSCSENGGDSESFQFTSLPIQSKILVSPNDSQQIEDSVSSVKDTNMETSLKKTKKKTKFSPSETSPRSRKGKKRSESTEHITKMTYKKIKDRCELLQNTTLATPPTENRVEELMSLLFESKAQETTEVCESDAKVMNRKENEFSQSSSSPTMAILKATENQQILQGESKENPVVTDKSSTTKTSSMKMEGNNRSSQSNTLATLSAVKIQDRIEISPSRKRGRKRKVPEKQELASARTICMETKKGNGGPLYDISLAKITAIQETEHHINLPSDRKQEGKSIETDRDTNAKTSSMRIGEEIRFSQCTSSSPSIVGETETQEMSPSGSKQKEATITRGKDTYTKMSPVKTALPQTDTIASLSIFKVPEYKDTSPRAKKGKKMNMPLERDIDSAIPVIKETVTTGRESASKVRNGERSGFPHPEQVSPYASQQIEATVTKHQDTITETNPVNIGEKNGSFNIGTTASMSSIKDPENERPRKRPKNEVLPRSKKGRKKSMVVGQDIRYTTMSYMGTEEGNGRSLQTEHHYSLPSNRIQETKNVETNRDSNMDMHSVRIGEDSLYLRPSISVSKVAQNEQVSPFEIEQKEGTVTADTIMNTSPVKSAKGNGSFQSDTMTPLSVFKVPEYEHASTRTKKDKKRNIPTEGNNDSAMMKNDDRDNSLSPIPVVKETVTTDRANVSKVSTVSNGESNGFPRPEQVSLDASQQRGTIGTKDEDTVMKVSPMYIRGNNGSFHHSTLASMSSIKVPVTENQQVSPSDSKQIQATVMKGQDAITKTSLVNVGEKNGSFHLGASTSISSIEIPKNKEISPSSKKERKRITVADQDICYTKMAYMETEERNGGNNQSVPSDRKKEAKVTETNRDDNMEISSVRTGEDSVFLKPSLSVFKVSEYQQMVSCDSKHKEISLTTDKDSITKTSPIKTEEKNPTSLSIFKVSESQKISPSGKRSRKSSVPSKRDIGKTKKYIDIERRTEEPLEFENHQGLPSNEEQERNGTGADKNTNAKMNYVRLGQENVFSNPTLSIVKVSGSQQVSPYDSKQKQVAGTKDKDTITKTSPMNIEKKSGSPCFKIPKSLSIFKVPDIKVAPSRDKKQRKETLPVEQGTTTKKVEGEKKKYIETSSVATLSVIQDAGNQSTSTYKRKQEERMETAGKYTNANEGINMESGPVDSEVVNKEGEKRHHKKQKAEASGKIQLASNHSSDSFSVDDEEEGRSERKDEEYHSPEEVGAMEISANNNIRSNQSTTRNVEDPELSSGSCASSVLAKDSSKSSLTAGEVKVKRKKIPKLLKCIKSMGPLKEEDIYVCKKCQKMYSSLREAKAHVKAHNSE